MKRLYTIIIIISTLLVSSCSWEEKPYDECIETVFIDNSLPKHDRPSIDTLNDFMEISDTVRIEDKLFKYSIFLPKTFDTVFGQWQGKCANGAFKTVFTNTNYHLDPTIFKRHITDTMYYVALAKDSSDLYFTINEDYRKENVELRRRNPYTPSNQTLDSSYVYSQSSIPRHVVEQLSPNIQALIRFKLIYKEVLFDIIIEYFGKLATQKLSEMRTVIQSFEVEEVHPPFNETVLQ
jgi:hypothetical protein